MELPQKFGGALSGLCFCIHGHFARKKPLITCLLYGLLEFDSLAQYSTSGLSLNVVDRVRDFLEEETGYTENPQHEATVLEIATFV